LYSRKMIDSTLKICIEVTVLAVLFSLFGRPTNAGLYPETRNTPNVCMNCQAALDECRLELDDKVHQKTQQGGILTAIWNSLFGTAVEMKADVKETLHEAQHRAHNLKEDVKEGAESVGEKVIETAENLVHGAQRKWKDTKESILETGERLREGYHHSNLQYAADERSAPDMSSYHAQRDFMEREESHLSAAKERLDKRSLEAQSLQARAASEVFLPLLIALSIGALLVMSVRKRSRMLMNFDTVGMGSEEVLRDEEVLEKKRIDQPGPIEPSKTRRRAH